MSRSPGPIGFTHCLLSIRRHFHITKNQLLDKLVEMINELMAAGTTTTVYRVGDFVDLCRGPHIPT